MVLKASSTVGGVPASGAIVSDGEALTLKGPDETQSFGSVTAEVAGGSVTGVLLPSGSTVITNQAGSVTVQDADGTQVSCTATIQPQTGQLSYVGVPGTAALVTNNMSVQVANNGGGGPLAGNAQITGGFLNWVALANATDCLLSNGFTTGISGFGVSGSTDFVTVGVSSGGLQSVAASLAPTKTVVTNSQQLTGVAPTGTYTNTVTFTVAGGVITAIALS